MAGFLGPNGAGKSTTLFMLPRLVRPTSGRIRIFGIDIWQEYKRAIRSVGILVETPAFYEYLSGRLNLELAARLLGNVSAPTSTTSSNASAWRTGNMTGSALTRWG